MSAQELEAAFAGWSELLTKGDLEGFYAAFDERAVVYDEDIPWRLSKSDFVDHIGFHAGGIWESFAWVPREVDFRVFGDTGVISGYATFRGKPRDAGFRQRFMAFTQCWAKQNGSWRLVCWHQGPLHGQIDGASPS